MVNKPQWKCWKCRSTSQWGPPSTSELTVLIVSFGYPIIIIPSFFSPHFFLVFIHSSLWKESDYPCTNVLHNGISAGSQAVDSIVSAATVRPWWGGQMPLWCYHYNTMVMLSSTLPLPIEKAWLCVGGFFSCPPTTSPQPTLLPHPQPFHCE